MAGKRGMKHYSKETKLHAVEMALHEEKSYHEIKEELELPRAELVEQWVYRYRREGEMGFCKKIGRPRKNRFSGEEYIAQLEMENALLKKYHTELRKLTLARRDIGQSNTTEGSIQ